MKRYHELDSIRGVAALAVFVLHLLIVLGFTSTAYFSFLEKSPLRILWSGNEAVIIFFVLSGFVLSLPFIKGNKVSYPEFIVKRFFRIYIPFVVTLVIAIIARSFLTIEGQGDIWSKSLSFGSVVEHIFLIGMYDQKQLNPVIWSLVHEMRIYIIFPLLMYFVVYKKITHVILGGTILSIAGIGLHYVFADKVDYYTNYFDTLHYVLMFIMGALLAKHREYIINKLRGLNKLTFSTVSILALLLYTYSSLLPPYVSDWFTASAGCIIIAVSMASSKISKMLNKKVFIELGNISYSLYLLHFIILLSFISLIDNAFVVLILTIISTFVVSKVSSIYLEGAGIKFGKKIASALKKNSELRNEEIA
ncbi:acyltransferase [Terribacillus sp. AE2B 122]|uniref:acyltransferase family protein n=1 Tax=Terribacillus sp. AE2B 122 TaxID=1331902 RepID=UPI001440945B|nr:acyltransferase [Terribacillus sp. AE2B 122]VVM35129.1 acyltransferase family protein [Terribacillus sp. AE2B 122]